MNDRTAWLAERRRPIAERFAEKVSAPTETGCLLWLGAVNANGYGSISKGGKGGRALTASRVAWELANGPIPIGMLVCHHCDNPLCMNPAHLFLGTNGDNRRDCAAKGRANGAPGETNRHAKLSASQALSIRADKRKTKELASIYGVCRTTIQRIRRKAIWSHL